MKAQIENLGAIHKAEIDVKPLTVFVGPNNTGKTWTVYTLAAILGSYGRDRYTEEYVSGEIIDLYPPIDSAVKHLSDEGNAKIDLVEFFIEYGNKYLNNLAIHMPKWMGAFLGSQRASFSKLKLSINLSDAELKKIIPKTILKLPIKSGLSIGKRGALLNAIKKKGEPEIYFYTKEQESKLDEKMHPSVIKDFVASIVFRGIHRAIYSRVYYFAAERTSLVSLANSIREVHRKEIPEGELKDAGGDTPNSTALAIPVGGLLEIITQARFTGSLENRLKESKKEPLISNYLKSAELLQEILGGNLDFTKPDACIDRELIFNYNSEVTISLDLAVVSSMVKDLSALVLYLQYIAMPGDLLVIDEPEMNLHPKAQVELIELLSILVNSGLNILITTHSPYVVDHLTNLMKAYSHKDADHIKDKFYLKRKEAFISSRDVSVYLFEKNTAKSILNKSGRIDWETFSSVSEQVSQLYFEL